MASMMQLPEGELRVETEQIDVTSNLPRPDKNWRHTDAAGHEHYWDNGYPTLVEVVDDTYWCDDCSDEHTESHLECPTCHQSIEPGMVGPPGYREYAPGRTSYYFNDEPITKAEAEELMQRMRRR